MHLGSFYRNPGYREGADSDVRLPPLVLNRWRLPGSEFDLNYYCCGFATGFAGSPLAYVSATEEQNLCLVLKDEWHPSLILHRHADGAVGTLRPFAAEMRFDQTLLPLRGRQRRVMRG